MLETRDLLSSCFSSSNTKPKQHHTPPNPHPSLELASPLQHNIDNPPDTPLVCFDVMAQNNNNNPVLDVLGRRLADVDLHDGYEDDDDSDGGALIGPSDDGDSDGGAFIDPHDDYEDDDGGAGRAPIDLDGTCDSSSAAAVAAAPSGSKHSRPNTSVTYAVKQSRSGIGKVIISSDTASSVGTSSGSDNGYMRASTAEPLLILLTQTGLWHCLLPTRMSHLPHSCLRTCPRGSTSHSVRYCSLRPTDLSSELLELDPERVSSMSPL